MKVRPVFIVYSILFIAILILGISYIQLSYVKNHGQTDTYKILKDTKKHRQAIKLSKEPVIIVTNEYPPYVYDDCKNRGFMMEIVEAALDIVEVNYQIEYYSWERCLYMVDNGLAWATFPYVRTDARDEDFVFSNEILSRETTITRFFYYKGNHDFETNPPQNYQDLEGFDIGGMKHYYYQSYFDLHNIKIEHSYLEEELFMKLKEDRIDLVPADYYVGQYLIDRYLPNDHDNFGFFDYDFELDNDNYHLMLDKFNEDADWLIDAFNEGLQIIIENGVYDEILNRHKVTSD